MVARFDVVDDDARTWPPLLTVTGTLTVADGCREAFSMRMVELIDLTNELVACSSVVVASR